MIVPKGDYFTPIVLFLFGEVGAGKEKFIYIFLLTPRTTIDVLQKTQLSVSAATILLM